MVPAIATVAAKNVNVDTAHPNPLARSSHLSVREGQMSGWKIGERIGKAAGLGRHAEDYFWQRFSLPICLYKGES